MTFIGRVETQAAQRRREAAQRRHRRDDRARLRRQSKWPLRVTRFCIRKGTTPGSALACQALLHLARLAAPACRRPHRLARRATSGRHRHRRDVDDDSRPTRWGTAAPAPSPSCRPCCGPSRPAAQAPRSISAARRRPSRCIIESAQGEAPWLRRSTASTRCVVGQLARHAAPVAAGAEQPVQEHAAAGPADDLECQVQCHGAATSSSAAAGRCIGPRTPRPPCRSIRRASGAGGSSCRCRRARSPSRRPGIPR